MTLLCFSILTSSCFTAQDTSTYQDNSLDFDDPLLDQYLGLDWVVEQLQMDLQSSQEQHTRAQVGEHMGETSHPCIFGIAHSDMHCRVACTHFASWGQYAWWQAHRFCTTDLCM